MRTDRTDKTHPDNVDDSSSTRGLNYCRNIFQLSVAAITTASIFPRLHLPSHELSLTLCITQAFAPYCLLTKPYKQYRYIGQNFTIHQSSLPKNLTLLVLSLNVSGTVTFSIIERIWLPTLYRTRSARITFDIVNLVMVISASQRRDGPQGLTMFSCSFCLFHVFEAIV